MGPVALRLGFSLIELLVVIAILAVLLGILWPATTGLADYMRQVRCMANMRQTGIAAMAYAKVNKGQLVPLKGQPRGNCSYTDLLFQYISPGAVDANGDGRVDHEYYVSMPIFRCPAAKVVVQAGNTGALNDEVLDYGINHYGCPLGLSQTYAPSLGASGPGWPWPRLSMVYNTQVIYFSDCDAHSSPEDIGGISRGREAGTGRHEWPLRFSFEGNFYQGDGQAPWGAYIRHREGYCATQLDGSAKWTYGVTPSNWLWYIRRSGE
ncbi:MAG: type II secretion system protein [Planctomycetota bacterium]|jgi:prepilin-type N-terminal cleavage/methylation domain-containing protein